LPLSPSPVGGVYLGGAGKSLEGIGQLVGVAKDPTTGNLVLLADHGREIKLPPLRIDDMVTVFRAVYECGKPPSVTINPREDNPHGPIMDVVHGEGTTDTYVGRVLFEADRMMKCYNLGKDNVSKAEVSSAVPGYSGVLDSIFFGGDFADGSKAGGNWERFWIVPSGVNRFRSSSKQLTLFDVPLKVKTQNGVAEWQTHRRSQWAIFHRGKGVHRVVHAQLRRHRARTRSPAAARERHSPSCADLLRVAAHRGDDGHRRGTA